MKVKFIGFGGYLDTPCYEDENGKIYFDENYGRGDLNLYTGAYRDKECNEICGEPYSRVTEPVECDEPYRKDESANKYMLLDRLNSDCRYFISCGGGLRIGTIWATPTEMIATMEGILNSFAKEEKPEWLTDEDFEKLKREVLEVEAKNPAVQTCSLKL